MSPSEWRAEVFDPAELDAADLYDDASAKTALYARLSRNAASSGDVAIAVAAAWAADVHAVQALWWERARDAGGGPFEPFLAAGAAISAAAHSTGGPNGVVPPANVAGGDDPRTARGMVEVARRGLLAAFDPSAALLVSARLAALDHLGGLPAPGAGPGSVAGKFAERVAGRTVGELLDELWTVAADARTIALALETAGYAGDAVAQLVLAETANFEAYLLRVAEAVGDTDLLGADLRRAALADVLPPLGDLPQELGAARLAVRDAMRTVLGAGELGRFARLLEAYDTAEVVVDLPAHVLRPAAVAPAVVASAQAAPPAPVPAVEPPFVAEPLPAPEPVLVAAEAVRSPEEVPACYVDDPRAEVAPAVAPAAPRLAAPPVVPAQVMRVPAPASAYLPTPARLPAPTAARDAAPAEVPAHTPAETELEAEAVPDVPSGPPVLPPARPLRHRDIFAQDLGGLGPRVGTLAPRRDS